MADQETSHPMDENSSFENILKQYDETVTTLERILASFANNSADEVLAVHNHFHQILLNRDTLQDIIDANTIVATSSAPRIAEIDARFRQTGQKALRIGGIDLAAWRAVLPKSKELPWWWNLDDTLEANEHTFEMLWTVLAVVFGAVAVYIISLTTQRLWAEGLEIFASITLVGQLLLGTGFVTERGQAVVVDLLSRLSFWRWLKGRVALVLAVVFLLITVAVYYVLLPFAATLLHESGIKALQAHNLTRARSYLEFAVQLNPDYAASLAQLGMLYETVGESIQAQTSFEHALAADSRLVFAHYRLAELYTDTGEITRAMNLLDQGLTLIDNCIDGQIDLPLEGDNQVQQVRFLMLVSRGRAFLEKGMPKGALIDLDAALSLAEAQHPDLFITVSNLASPPQNALRTTELHLHRARAFTALYADTGIQEYQEQAFVEWRVVQQLADQDDSQERQWLLEADAQFSSKEDGHD